MVSSHSSNKARQSSIALALTLALFGGWSSNALSATTCTSDCDALSDLSDNLQSPEVSVEALSVSPLDPTAKEANTAGFDSLEGLSLSGYSAAPFLYLTPRVASVLQEIFDATRDEVSEPELLSSPFAESDEWVDISKLLEDTSPTLGSQTESENALPLLQRQMFRTDI